MDQQPTTDLEALRQLGALLDGGYLISDKRGIVTQAAEEIERLREVLQLATNALSDGLWDYGPGQDEHDKCDEVIEICRAALAQERGGCDATQSQDRETCSWSYDESDGAHQTSCGNMHIIIDGTPDDNGMKYCCYCGGRITPAIDHARRVEGDGK